MAAWAFHLAGVHSASRRSRVLSDLAYAATLADTATGGGARQLTAARSANGPYLA